MCRRKKKSITNMIKLYLKDNKKNGESLFTQSDVNYPPLISRFNVIVVKISPKLFLPQKRILKLVEKNKGKNKSENIL